MSIEIERHKARIGEEDNLYHAYAYSLWEVWFKIVSDEVVEVVEDDTEHGENRTDYVQRAAKELIYQQKATLVRDKDGTVVAELVVNEIE